MSSLDPVSVGESIGAAYLLISSTISAVQARRAHKQVQTPNGDTLGDIAWYLHKRNHDLMENQMHQYVLSYTAAQQNDAIGKALGAKMPELPPPADLHRPGDLNETIEDLRHRSGLDR